MPPAAANDGGKSSHKSQSHSSVTKNAAAATTTTTTTTATATASDPKTTKLCHIVKRSDFDGYGFNLHTEKSKPGQFIGKVDANSPAEAAGLREGFRILEVNGIPINNETHKQVVQRIKAIAWEVKLLVSIDEAENIKVEDIAIAGNKAAGVSSNGKMTTNNGNTGNNKSTPTTPTTTPLAPMATAAPTTTPPPPAAASASAMNSNANNEHANNGKQHAGNMEMMSSTTTKAMSTTTTTTATITPPPPPSMTTKHNDNAAVATAAATAAPSVPSSASALKLPSTAAEMRAILQSKKKFNPKNEEVNLQEKYEIIQKL